MGTDISVDIKSKHFFPHCFYCVSAPETPVTRLPLLLCRTVEFPTKSAIIDLSVKPTRCSAELQSQARSLKGCSEPQDSC